MSVDFGRRVVVVRPHRRASGRFSLRPALVSLVLVLAALAAGVLFGALVDRVAQRLPRRRRPPARREAPAGVTTVPRQRAASALAD